MLLKVTLLALLGLTASPPVAHIGTTTGPAEQRLLETYLDETWAVLQSPAYAANAAALAQRYPKLFAGPELGEMALERVFQLIRLETAGLGPQPAGLGPQPDPQAGLRYMPVAVSLVGAYPPANRLQYSGNADFTALTGRTGWTPDSDDGVLMLGRGHLGRFRSPNLVEKSCAINTLAHELLHTLSIRKDSYWMPFIDTALGQRTAGMPLVTYFAGSLAQCTYLQQHGRIVAADLADCVQVFGTENFNALRCNAFGPTDPIREPQTCEPHCLPAAAPPL